MNDFVFRRFFSDAIVLNKIDRMHWIHSHQHHHHHHHHYKRRDDPCPKEEREEKNTFLYSSLIHKIREENTKICHEKVSEKEFL